MQNNKGILFATTIVLDNDTPVCNVNPLNSAAQECGGMNPWTNP